MLIVIFFGYRMFFIVLWSSCLEYYFRFNISYQENLEDSNGSDLVSDVSDRLNFSSITKVSDALDKELAASGFTKKVQADIEKVG